MKHASAVVDPSSEIASDVKVGAFAVIGANVKVGMGCKLATHCVLEGPTTMGAHNEVFPFAVIGSAPQDKRNKDAATGLSIGENNVFREHVTVHRGTRETDTRIGSFNLFMVGAHIAHDVVIGSHCVIANGVQLAGHCRVHDHVTFGGLAGVAQFVSIGEGAFVAAGAMVERDVPPFVIVQGDRARVRAINKVGLERRGVAASSISEVERVFRVIYMQKSTRAEALSSVTTDDPWAKRFVDAVRAISSVSS
jgi:UDP-N-acetylglucosamine acyltransferase